MRNNPRSRRRGREVARSLTGAARRASKMDLKDAADRAIYGSDDDDDTYEDDREPMGRRRPQRRPGSEGGY